MPDDLWSGHDRDGLGMTGVENLKWIVYYELRNHEEVF